MKKNIYIKAHLCVVHLTNKQVQIELPGLLNFISVNKYLKRKKIKKSHIHTNFLD